MVFDDYDAIRAERSGLIDFEDVPFEGMKSGIDEVFARSGARLGERFAGQTLLRGDVSAGLQDFDALAGPPSAPLTLLSGDRLQNLSLFRTFSNQGVGLYGESWVGFPSPSSGGEGVVAIQFDKPQSAFGFRVHAASGAPRYALGQLKITCFEVSGTPLGALVFDQLEWDTVQGIGIAHADGAARIGGCTIENTDPKGVIFDDFVFEPTAAALS